MQDLSQGASLDRLHETTLALGVLKVEVTQRPFP